MTYNKRIRHSKRYILKMSDSKGNDIVGLGKNIAFWRKKRGMTQRELAVKAGISKGYLVSIEGEKWRPQIKTVAMIVEALGVDLETILNDNVGE